MTNYLFTMLFSNDLGLSTRTLPVAAELQRRGHTVAFCNPEEAPSKLIGEAKLHNLPIQPHWSSIWPPGNPEIWDVDHFETHMGYLDGDWVRVACQDFMALINDYGVEVVVDSFNLASCMAARILHKPLVTIIQADMHPASRGFIWWREKLASTPSPVPVLNEILGEHNLPTIHKANELYVGDLTLVVGIPDTDPLPEGTPVTYIGSMLWQQDDASLPHWIDSLPHDRPLIWLYTGTPRYDSNPMWADSIVVLRAGIAALVNEPVEVIVTSGHQPLPAEVGALPSNFHYVPYLPGLALARRSDLLIHHGGHGSYMTGLSAGTPAVIIPTFSERESNARRNAALGAGEFLLPTVGEHEEKHVAVDELREKVRRVLADPSYKRNAKRISERLEAYGGVDVAADYIEKLSSVMNREGNGS